MKAAIIGSFDNYGHMGNWVADAFEDIGDKVTRIDRYDIKDVNEHDFAICVDCSEDFSQHIESINIPTAFWSMDAHMPGGLERSVNIARKCDVVFSSNKEHGVDLLAKFGINSYLMPITYSERLISVSKRRLPHFNAVMIGNPNSNERKQLWDLLHNTFKNVVTGPVDCLTYKDAMSNTLRVVNQPTEPWDNILNNRFFEGLASGGTLYQKRLKTTLIEDLGFIDGEDFIYWNDLEDLKDKLKLNLENSQRESAMKKVSQYSMTEQVSKLKHILLTS